MVLLIEQSNKMSLLNLSQEKLASLRREYKCRQVKGKYPRQKMLPEYRLIYPWVMADDRDPYFAFCTICECRLSAKRSDLGKHQRSFKHSENAAKRSTTEGGLVMLKGTHQSHEYNGSYDVNPLEGIAEALVANSGDTIIQEQYIKQELDADTFSTHLDVLQPTRNSEPAAEGNDKEGLRGKVESSDNDEEDEGGDDEDDDEENTGEAKFSTYESEQTKRRRISETGSSQPQHSTALECLPPQVTIRDGAPNAGMSTQTRSCFNAHAIVGSAAPYTAPIPTPVPYKITIKKVPQATTSRLMPSITVQPKSINKGNQTLLTPSQQSAQLTRAAQFPARDAYDLFFDSICSSVRALPPKLATEGKVRVMQLVGELEVRAITEREQSATNSAGSILHVAPSRDTGGGSAGCQQNATVVSTTK